MAEASVCGSCVRRTWLIEALAPRLEQERARILELLALADDVLIDRLGGEHRTREDWQRFGVAEASAWQTELRQAGLGAVCRHRAGFPAPLFDLAAVPALLTVNGGLARLSDLLAPPRVAVVGTRRASEAGAAMARELGRGLAGAGVTVVSGMAFGIDSAAHEGAVAGGGATIAVLAGAPQRAYPAARAPLMRQILTGGCVIGEQGPRGRTWRWALQARNRIIGALAQLTVLVEGPERSGALLTVAAAAGAGRPVAAVPGPVHGPGAAGPNRLLARARAGEVAIPRERVWAVRDAQDILDLILGEGERRAPAAARPTLAPAEAALRDRIAGGVTNAASLEPADLIALAALEVKGWVRRGLGGVLTVQPG